MLFSQNLQFEPGDVAVTTDYAGRCLFTPNFEGTSQWPPINGATVLFSQLFGQIAVDLMPGAVERPYGVRQGRGLRKGPLIAVARGHLPSSS